MSNIEPTYFTNYEQLSIAASNLILERISASKNILIGVATGQSPLRTYELVGNHLKKRSELRERIRIFQLDEWFGISSSQPQSCHYFIHQHITAPWKLKKEMCFLLEGDSINPQAQIQKMSTLLNQRPLDLCILGLGENGHLALNEPGSSSEDTFRIVNLSRVSQSHPMLEGQQKKVEKGMTIGMKEILEAHEILLLVFGKNKKEITHQLLSRKEINKIPASVLQQHKNWHCYIDQNVLT